MKTSQKIKNAKTSKEVKRILRANTCKCRVKDECDCRSLKESNSLFAKKFLFNIVKEAEELDAEKLPEDFDQETNEQDFKNALEPDTSDNQFDVEGLDPSITADNISTVHDWTEKLDKFAHFLNDPDTQSLHKILASNDRPGSLLRGVTRKASDAITRIAGEITKLKEVLNTFVILAPKKQRDADQLKMS